MAGAELIVSGVILIAKALISRPRPRKSMI